MEAFVLQNKGLPGHLQELTPLLEQYKPGSLTQRKSGLLVFPAGEIYATVADPENSGKLQWIFFSRMRLQGMARLRELIASEFMQLQQEEWGERLQESDYMIWKATLDGYSNQLWVLAGLYENLPPVFRKIDETINRFMYRINEL